MNSPVVVIGIGNEYRRDDGVGAAVVAAINERALPGVRLVTGIENPMDLLDAWSAAARGMSSHSLNVAEVFALGQALDRVPDELVVFTVGAADTGHGVGLTPQLAAVVPEVVAAAVAEIVSRQRNRIWVLDDNLGH